MLALEVVVLPVADIDRALVFYTQRVGFNLDVDYCPTPDFRVVQLTPPGSHCSVQLVAAHGAPRVEGLVLVTDDLVAATQALVSHGIAVNDIRHKVPLDPWAGGFEPGVHPQRADYASFAQFADLDGNRWTLQERGYRAA
jgi:catechol 2,3-dioxygenase-like lactoylglutathione lyase family enzyme